MSSMLSQAIVDAAALKEAALRNAEQQVLEKYSKDIKEAVDALLEQDEFDLGGEFGAVDEVPERDEETIEELPDSYMDDEDDEGDGKITIDLADLVKAVEGEDREEVADAFSDAMGLDADAESLEGGALDGELDAPSAGLEDSEGLLPEEPSALEEEDIVFEEEQLNGLLEKLSFERNKVASGLAAAPTSYIEEEQEVRELADKIEEENKDLKEENENLEEEKKELKESLNTKKQENHKLKLVILKLKEKLDEVSVSNARLIYTNRVMGDDSLNERQKNKIVEKISKAQTIEEAKTIHEALQSAVDAAPKKRQPKSLNEVVTRQSTQVFSRSNRSEGHKAGDQLISRMQRLAGIKKN